MSTEPSLPTALVVGFDGSPADVAVAETALDLAIELAVPLELVRAIDMGSGDEPASTSPGGLASVHETMTTLVRERTREAVDSLEKQRLALAARAGSRVEIRTKLIERRPYEALLEEGSSERRWIVVGSRRGRSVLARTVDLVLRRAIHPVLVVPDGAAWQSGGVLAGVDAGELDARVLRVAEAPSRKLARRLGIVHVRTNGDDSAMLRVTSHIRDVAPSAAATATLSVMRVERSIAATLSDHATRADAGLLVIGTHGRHGLARWVLGSTAEALAHVSTRPFLVVR